MSKIKVNEIEKVSGSGITIPTGTSFTVTDGLAASTISSGTLADARLPTVPVSKGGTGLTSLGSAGQAIKVNSGGNALEFGSVAGGKVLQYVSNFDNTEVAANVGQKPNFAMSNRIDLAITPSATSSRILVMYNFGTISSGAAGNIGYGVIKVSNDGFSSNETIPVSQGSHQVTSNYSHFGINLNDQTYQTNQGLCCSFIHHPNSTSAQTYRPKFWTESSGGHIYINRSERNSGNDFSSVAFAYAMELQG